MANLETLPVEKPESLATWTHHARTLGAALVTIILWASAFAGIRAGLRSYSPESVALLRYLTASVALALIALLTRMPLPRVRDIPWIFLMGFLGFAFYNVALNAGEQKIPAGTASMIIASAPIYVALFASLWFHEKVRLGGWVGIFTSFTGVAIISIENGHGLQLSSTALLVLAAALAQALYSVLQKPLLQRYSPLQFTSYAIWTGTALMLFFLPGLLRQIPSASLSSSLAVVYMGIFPGAIGYACWSVVLSRLPASQAGSFLYLIPATAILIAWLWLGELPEPGAFLGGGFILLGVILVNMSRRSHP